MLHEVTSPAVDGTAGDAPGGALDSVEAVAAALDRHDYLADEGLATVVFLALRMRRPLLLEGAAGVGKTEVAKALAAITGGELLRVQCYEGIDRGQVLYEWDHARQLLHLRTAEAAGRISGEGADAVESELYTDRFLLSRPLLQAIEAADGPPPVLLIDEIDRADDEFEAFLLEILSDWSITIPELGTRRATVPPVVILTSNRTRDVHDALKRRCLYHWVDHPDPARELAILQRRVPGTSEALARQVASATHELRQIGLYKPPGVAEAIDWTTALTALDRTELDAATVDATLGAVVKYREDAERVHRHGVAALLGNDTAAGGPAEPGAAGDGSA
jgi:MoxR-like ATPase